MDRIDPVLGATIAAAVGVLGYGSLGLVDNPLRSAMYGLTVLLGAAQISMIIASQVLVAKKAPLALHGTVAGCFSLYGGLGVMTSSYVGGQLFDVWIGAAPFVLTSATSLLLAFMGCAVLYRRRGQGKSEGSANSAQSQEPQDQTVRQSLNNRESEETENTALSTISLDVSEHVESGTHL
jgi:hypothetical protein